MRILLATFRNWAWSSFLVLQESFKCLKSHISTLVKCSFYLYAFNYFGKSTRWTAQVKIHISTWRNKKPVSWVRTTYSVFQKQYFTPRNTVILSVPQVAYIAGMELFHWTSSFLLTLSCLVSSLRFILTLSHRSCHLSGLWFNLLSNLSISWNE